MKITIWIGPAGYDPFRYDAEVQDELGISNALADAFAALRKSRPGQALMTVPIRIEERA